MSDHQAVTFVYRNHRGEEAVRRVIPTGLIYSESVFHKDKERTWFLHGFDLDRQEERTYALDDVLAWGAEASRVFEENRRLRSQLETTRVALRLIQQELQR